jgi:hypothetical protein
MVKRLTRLKINEVSSVDRGAGEGVKVVLFKRQFSQDARDAAAESGAAMPDGSYPIKNASDLKNAIQAYGRAKNPAAAKAHIISRARALGLTDELPDGWVSKALEKALDCSELTIRKDGTISTDSKIDRGLAKTLKPELKNGVEDAAKIFCESCAEIMASPGIGKEALLEKSYGEFVEHVGKLGTEEDAPAIAAALLEALGTEDENMDPKEIEALKAQAAEAEKLKAEIAKRDTEIAKRDAELVLAKMSAEHKAHAEKLSGDAKAKFLAMSAEERDAELKKALSKRDEDPIFKAMNEQIAKVQSENAELKKRLDAEEDAKERVAFGKRAADVYGQPEAFGETLRKAYKGDKDAQTEVEKVTLSIKRMAETGEAFKNFGKNGGNADSPKAQVAAKAEELRKSDPKMTYEKAFAKVLMDPANKQLAADLRQAEMRGEA